MRTLILAAVALSLQAAPAPKPVDFQKEIRPILSDKCFACHGPDEAKRMAKLRLDSAPEAPVIVAGKPGESKLFQRVAHEKKGLRMPPPASGLTLTDAEIALLKRWIEEGGKYQMHWAFQPPQRVEPSVAALPAWDKNPIDRFVYARLLRNH